MNTRTGQIVADIRNSVIGLLNVVDRAAGDKWEGPLSLLDVNGEDCIILLPHCAGPSKFRFPFAKPFIPDAGNTEKNGANDNTPKPASSRIVSSSYHCDFV